jgi:hypothetical protein
VTDNLTGLIWEKKTDDSSIHDAANEYTWSPASCMGESGTAFSLFLRTLNEGAGFDGSNGWRLPTIVELNSLLLPEPYPCVTVPCIDPIFGPLDDVDPTLAYLSSTPSNNALPGASCLDDSTLGGGVWVTLFRFGAGGNYTTNVEDPGLYARAVRGGL